MSKEFNLQEVLLGATLFFIEEGLVIGAGPTTVSKLAIPAGANADDFQALGCANDLTPWQETQADTPRRCFDGNRFRTTTKQIVNAEGWEFTINDHIEPVWRLMLGLSAEITDETPVPVYAEAVREINGYLKFQARNVHTKGDLFVMDIWGKLTLAELPTYADTTVQPKLRFEVLDSDNNVTTLYNAEDIPNP